jgi:DNA-binding CsgD family transcriptional regulator/pimeloyl-ACP methyl ester carboxylesterase
MQSACPLKVTMEKTTQYTRTSDGVKIAFTTQGKGVPYLELPPIPFCHGAGPAEVPEWQAWDEAISQRGMLVMYDSRGTGMSDRDVTEYSLDGWVRDIEAVVDALEIETCAMFAPDSLAVPAAIAYAVRHPDRVSHLVLWQAHPHVRHILSDPGFATVLELIDRDWTLFSQVLVQVMEGYVPPETAQREAAMVRELHTQEGLKAAFRAAEDVDVTGLLPKVKAPTLVLHRRGGRQALSESMEVASGIPSAGLTVVDGSAFSWALEHPEAVLEALDDFLGWKKAPEAVNGDGVLSPREQQVLDLLVEGRSAREIGAELMLGVRTVERHISNIYRKIGAHNRAQATAFALSQGLTKRS